MKKCRVCSAMHTRKAVVCDQCRIRNTIQKREANRIRANAFSDGRLCGLCRGTGHNYRTCPVNPEAIR